MILSKKQRDRFWIEWKQACEAQGWTTAQSWTGAQIDNERHALLQRAGFESLTLVDKQGGFDRVLAELALLHSPSDLNAQLDVADGDRKRLIHSCRSQGFPDSYIAVIARDRFGSNDYTTLPIPQFELLRNTLANRARARKKKDLTEGHEGNEARQSLEPLTASGPQAEPDPF